jgi:hypothetical protein
MAPSVMSRCCNADDHKADQRGLSGVVLAANPNSKEKPSNATPGNLTPPLQNLIVKVLSYSDLAGADNRQSVQTKRTIYCAYMHMLKLDNSMSQSSRYIASTWRPGPHDQALLPLVLELLVLGFGRWSFDFRQTELRNFADETSS